MDQLLHYRAGLLRVSIASLVFSLAACNQGRVGNGSGTIALPPPPASSAVFLEIDISDSPSRAPDGTFTFRVVADTNFPEDNKPTGHPHVEFSPYVQVKESDSSSESGRITWTYSAKVDGNDKNLVRVRASLCETASCTGKIDKTKQRIIDLGPSKFDDYTVMVHPRQLTAGTPESEAYIALERQGHVLTPTSTLKLHASARDRCVQFALKPEAPRDSSIDLVIDAERRRSQTEYFTLIPATLPPENCVIDVAVYDDEKQRVTPSPDQLSMKTNTLTSTWMSFLGTLAAFLFTIWRRIRHAQKPLVHWSDLFEIVAKGFLAILLGLVLTKTDFIGITIDKTSANGFFTTGFLLGFVPLDTIFDKILRSLGVTPPADDSPPGAQPVLP